jgi:hypothetical protein
MVLHKKSIPCVNTRGGYPTSRTYFYVNGGLQCRVPDSAKEMGNSQQVQASNIYAYTRVVPSDGQVGCTCNESTVSLSMALRGVYV